MIRSFFLFLLSVGLALFLAAGCAGHEGYLPAVQVPAASPLASAIQAYVSAIAAADQFSGDVVVSEHGRMTLSSGFGYADRETKRPNSDDTVYRIASLTKQFTAAAVLLLEKQGKLSVDDPVSKYLAGVPRARLSKNGREVTLRHLLTHTSGIVEPVGFIRERGWTPRTFDETIAATLAQPLETEPGTHFRYSNTGYMFLGRVVEIVSGMPFEVFLAQDVFGPAGMKESGITLPRSLADREAVGYRRPGTLSSFTHTAEFQDPTLSRATASGAVFTTPRDLLAWSRALAGEDILSREEKMKLFTPYRGNYAFGWMVARRGGKRILWHNGSFPPLGFTSLFIRIPETQTALVFLANLDLDQLPSDFDRQILNLVATTTAS